MTPMPFGGSALRITLKHADGEHPQRDDGLMVHLRGGYASLERRQPNVVVFFDKQRWEVPARFFETRKRGLGHPRKLVG